MSTTTPRRIHHIDIVVKDLDLAAERYREILGIESQARESLDGRGIDLVRFKIGETWLILVQPTRDDSPVAAFLERHGEGFFHMAFEVADIEDAARALRDREINLVNRQPRIGVDGWKLVDIELSESFGAMIQLVEAPEPP
jgi:methylmalonyl-CoA/ethylmalonyl-CoA epimerase